MQKKSYAFAKLQHMRFLYESNGTSLKPDSPYGVHFNKAEVKPNKNLKPLHPSPQYFIPESRIYFFGVFSIAPYIIYYIGYKI